MVSAIVALVALVSADHHEPADTGCGFGSAGTIEAQFDRCLATVSEAEACPEGALATHAGFTNASGEFCPIDYLIRDPHTGGFRIGYECPGETRQITVLIIDDGALNSGDQISGFRPVDWQCSSEN